MKRTINPSETPAIWNAEALYAKAERYIQQMGTVESDSWEYALLSSLALEHLIRSALSNVSPALLADSNKSWSSLFHALGFTPKEERYSPKSISIGEALNRIVSIIPNFTKEHENFCTLHMGRRNAELHSGEAAFDGIKNSMWQPRFYQVCDILLISMGMTLNDLLGQDEAKVARKLIEAAIDEGAKAVKGDVDAHKKVWASKDEKEKKTLTDHANLWAARHAGHRVRCPACGSRAMVVGEPVSEPIKKLDEDEITETQEYLPNQFECIACGLRISSLSRLSAVGLGDRFKKTQTYDAAEYYATSDVHAGYEDDNNEP